MQKVWNRRDPATPPQAVYVGRPSKWGNPYRIGPDGTREEVIRQFADWLTRSGLDLTELKGRDLVCWCAPQPCHGNILILRANTEAP